jgi:hypothetical protein
MTARSEAAQNHQEPSAGFSQRVHGTDPTRWNDPSPVQGWRARDVVGHLVTWLPGFLEGGSDIRLAPTPSADDDPVAAWEAHAAHVQELLDDPATDDLVYRSPMGGEIPLAQAIDQF